MENQSQTEQVWNISTDRAISEYERIDRLVKLQKTYKRTLEKKLEKYTDAVDELRDVLRKLSVVSGVELTLRDIEQETTDYYLQDVDEVLERFAAGDTEEDTEE